MGAPFRVLFINEIQENGEWGFQLVVEWKWKVEVWKGIEFVSEVECRGFDFRLVIEWGRVSRFEKLAKKGCFNFKFEWNLEWTRVFNLILLILVET